MDYTRFARKKRHLSCPYCGSASVNPILLRAESDSWFWQCHACDRASNYDYAKNREGNVIGVKLYPLKGMENVSKD
jgi:hypothetical protein